MLTNEENEFLMRVGPGTPAGELLRRYWQPIAIAQELTPENPTKFVRILGEDLVLFMDKTGRAGLLADHCSHRGASLLYGRVEERGIACAYHGWLYDAAGNVLETPPERNEAIIKSVKQTAYPVQRFIGLYWAYLGPEPAPLIPPYDILVRQDGRRSILVLPQLDYNWFQAMENSVDPAHLQILHQEYIANGRPVNTTRGFTDDVAQTDFYQTDWGAIMKRRQYHNGHVDEHPLIFPTILRQGSSAQIRVPVDDTHTLHMLLTFEPTEDGNVSDSWDTPSIAYAQPFKVPADGIHPAGRFTWEAERTPNQHILAQDHMVWETQGPMANRSAEHLSYSDRGVVMLRRVLRENILRVEQGLDPVGVIRDPNHAIIDTNLEKGKLELRASRGMPATARG